MLRSHEPELREAGLGGLYLFGSTASGGATASSDVDLFFDISQPKGFDLFRLAALKERLESIVGTKVDVMSRQAIHPRRRAPVEEGAVRVF